MDPRRIKGSPARHWFFPPRTLNQLMSVVALSGLALAALPPRFGVPPARPPRRLTPFGFPGGPVPLRPVRPADRFLVAPPEGLDPGMVVAAPAGIDDGMIASPGGPVLRPATPDVFPFDPTMPILPPAPLRPPGR